MHEARDHVVGDGELAAGRRVQLEVGTSATATLLTAGGAGATAPPLTPGAPGTD